MKLLSPYSSWRDRLRTLAEISLLAALPLAVHFIFWSDAGIDATGRSLTADQYEAIHEMAESRPAPEVEPICEGCFRVE
ncbi:MAG: hypothetical protein GY913_00510 [Proteobacteria bacterium]|nr:hypothetical protein [Pseudomonadota bacterium]MCP4915379.1 hypothetical protein [Pseudomonadota bacterium]